MLLKKYVVLGTAELPFFFPEGNVEGFVVEALRVWRPLFKADNKLGQIH